MDVQHLREFVMLAETLSYTRTAELLYLSQSTVSRHVAAMEAELGVRLVERSTRQVRLTPAGRIAYESFRPIIDRYDEGLRRIRRDAVSFTGSLRISSPYYFTEKYLEPVVRYFSNAYPDCEVHVISCQPIEGIEQMRTGMTDLVLNMRLASKLEGVSGIVLANEPLGAVMSTRDPLAFRETVSLAELTPTALVRLDGKRYEVFRDAYVDYVSQALPKLERVVEVEQIDMVPLVIQQTGGMAILPYEVRHLDRSYVRTVRIEDPQAFMRMCLYWRDDNDNPALAPFVEAARMVFPGAR